MEKNLRDALELTRLLMTDADQVAEWVANLLVKQKETIFPNTEAS